MLLKIMYLKELTINGFKSFAKKSELKFTAPITSIVGPNGSGKSNIAESFRFVLGEQSVKSMRGKKGEDLIWGGSEKVSRGNRASVQVIFDNKNRALALDFDEVKIERTVHRDGQNEYKLNDSTVRLKDVHELLANANIGSTGHHIISQGEADRVLAAGPKERREMIEDALGLKVYQLKKHESERKLEKTKENISQVESLRREAAPHLRYMKKQVEKAERSLEVQKELKLKYAEYLKREDTYVAFHFDRLTQERVAPTAQLTEVKKKLEEVKTILAKTEEVEESADLKSAEATLAEATKVRQVAEKAHSGIEGQISFLERRISAAVNKPAETDGFIKRSALEKLVSGIESETTLLKDDDVSVLKNTLDELVKKLRAFLNEGKVEQVDTTEADKKELSELQSELEKATVALEKARHDESRVQEKLAALQTEQQAESNKNREAERDMFALINEQRELELKVKNIDSELAVLNRDRDDFKQQLQEAVTLLGQSATDYFTYEVRDEAGQSVDEDQIVSEDRSKQKNRQFELEKLKIRLEELGVGATEDLVKEYEEAKARDEFLAKELSDLEESVENLKKLIVEMDEKLHSQFSAGVERITKEFHSFFTLMFGGGSAALKQVEIKVRSDDEEEEKAVQTGVELEVSLPNKRVKGLEMLSGGERALTSIALIFAMSQVNPPPFIILDETDAALDEANSRRYGDMIEALAKKSQLVLITHNRETMSRAGVLYGITMGGDGVSKTLSVQFEEAAAVAK